MYYASGVGQHAGIAARAGRVISKWGRFPVYDHSILEVPVSYGDDVRYFRMPDARAALTHFVEFAEVTHGISDEDITQAIEYEG